MSQPARSRSSDSTEIPVKPNDAEAQNQPSFFDLMGRWLRHLSRGDNTLKEAIEEVLEEHESETATLAPEEKVMLKNMLSFGELKVSDIMVPRTDIAAVEAGIDLEHLKKHIIEQRHTRVPVYEASPDKIRGFVHVKDLVPMLGGETPYDLAVVLRQVLFVPGSMRIVDLLLRMRLSGVHMAIVIDEYGSTDGLVTLEDLFEEIVGEIQDEHDEVEDYERLTVISERVIDADARIDLEKLEEELGLELVNKEQETTFGTLGGLISFILGRMPEPREMIEHASGARFEIMEADPRRIRKVRLHLPTAESLAEAAEGK